MKILGLIINYCCEDMKTKNETINFELRDVNFIRGKYYYQIGCYNVFKSMHF